jgi:hypothetical protein
LVTDVFVVLEAAYSPLTAAISGVSATAALNAKPEASKPNRAMPREFIDERPFADGLVGSGDSSCGAPADQMLSQLIC